MASCSGFGVETELYYGSVPLCLKYSDLWEAKRKSQATTRQISRTLLQGVLELKPLKKRPLYFSG